MIEGIEKAFEGNYQRFYSKYLQQVKRIGGDEHQAICPFHDDRKPSFNFNNQTGKFFCHGCGKKGHIVHFYAKLNGLNIKGCAAFWVISTTRSLTRRDCFERSGGNSKGHLRKRQNPKGTTTREGGSSWQR